MLRDRSAAFTGLGIGAGLMYFLDPERGRRRRALVRDKLAHSAHVGADAVAATGRDLLHRSEGGIARARGLVRRERVDDSVLVERVRALLGRYVSHPHAIDVDAHQGRVTLRGPILSTEAKRLLPAVERVRGVRDIANALEEHTEPGRIPALQGGSSRPAPHSDVLQRNWAPATRLLVGTTGTALVGYGASRRDVPGAIAAASGLGLIVRAASNLDVRRLTGIGARRRAVDVQKTIVIDAPVDEVYGFWTEYQTFPRFMSRVLDVRRAARDDRSHWTVAGPAGTSVEFDAEVTALVPNRVFGWRTIARAPVAHAGLVHFETVDAGRTRVHIRMSYNPPGGWLGHGVAAAFGVDPKSSLDADLARMKTLIETGRPPRDAAKPLWTAGPHER